MQGLLDALISCPVSCGKNSWPQGGRGRHVDAAEVDGEDVDHIPLVGDLTLVNHLQEAYVVFQLSHLSTEVVEKSEGGAGQRQRHGAVLVMP
jgi:hypothetical protein